MGKRLVFSLRKWSHRNWIVRSSLRSGSLSDAADERKIYRVYRVYHAVAATTVKISNQANRKLDSLQARQRLRHGGRITKQSILEKLIDRALEEDEPFFIVKPPEYPLPNKIRRMLRNHPVDWGVETREEDIDRILYGAKK